MFKKLKDFSVLFYVIEGLFLIVSGVISYLGYDNYVDWHETYYILSVVGTALLGMVSGAGIGVLKKRKWYYILVEAFLFGAVLASIPFICDAIFKTLLGWDTETTGKIFLFVQNMIFSVGNIVFLLYSFKVFSFEKNFVPTVLIAIMLVLSTLTTSAPTLIDTLKSVSTAVSCIAEPSVYYSKNDTYRIIFATNVPAEATLVVLDDEGKEETYLDIINGVERFDSLFHRFDIPCEKLNGHSYYVTYRKTINGKNYGVNLGETHVGKTYHFHDYSEKTFAEGELHTGDLDFLVVSDVQGAFHAAQNAVSACAEKYDYDFVLMLGDFSSQYNDDLTDFIEPIFKISAMASRSEIPCLYVIGNHENKGMKAKLVNELLPTPSEEDNLYYTFTIGGAYFTALNFGDDHDDTMARYNGINHFNDYKDEEYNWLVNTVLAKKEYENYQYNIILSHIPILSEPDEKEGLIFADKLVCRECTKIEGNFVLHNYKWKEFIAVYMEMGVHNIVSGHTHMNPAEILTADYVEGYTFNNLNGGANINSGTAYQNCIVHLHDGEMSITNYSSLE